MTAIAEADHGLVVYDETDVQAYRRLAAAVLEQAWHELRSGQPPYLHTVQSHKNSKYKNTGVVSAFRSYLSAIRLLSNPRSLWISMVEVDGEVQAEQCHLFLLHRFGRYADELERIAREGWPNDSQLPPGWWIDLRKGEPHRGRRKGGR